MNPLNLEALRNARVMERPPTWLLIDGLLNPAAAGPLCDEYPREGFVHCERSDGEEKHYRFDVLNVIDHDRALPALDHLTDRWRTLVMLLAGSEYRAALAQRLGKPLDPAMASVGFYRYGPGDWVAPHLDKSDKLLTQLFYFNHAWEDAWGGRLKMLERGDAAATCAALPPCWQQSAIILRSDTSWHMVEPLAAAAPQPRLSVQLELWRAPR